MRWQSHYLGLLVWFQSQQATHCLISCMDDTGTHEVVWVRIYTIQQLHTKPQELGANCIKIHWLRCFENFLGSLMIAGKTKFRIKINGTKGSQELHMHIEKKTINTSIFIYLFII
jgi:hypothetical protein